MRLLSLDLKRLPPRILLKGEAHGSSRHSLSKRVTTEQTRRPCPEPSTKSRATSATRAPGTSTSLAKTTSTVAGKHHTYKELRDMHVYVPPKRRVTNHTTSQTERHDPVRPFTLATYQSCGSNEDNDGCVDHDHPIIVGVGSKGKNPAACGVFCNTNSTYNTTFMLDEENLELHEIKLHLALAALKSVATFMSARVKKRDIEFKNTKQIIIKTTSSWLVHKFTAALREHFRYRDLSYEFDELVDETGEFTGVRPVVKFWKVRGVTIAQQLAEARLRGWEEAQDQIDSETENGTDD